MALKVVFGLDAGKFKHGEKADISWQETDLVNPHMLIVGMTGSGKTHLLRRVVRQLAQSADKPIRVHVFDVHGDIEFEEASTVMFSEQTAHGLNPLMVNPDPHYGGVRKRIQSFISILNRAHTLGTKQENVIRNLLIDLYAAHGFQANNPETWIVNSHDSEIYTVGGRLYLDVPFVDKEAAAELGASWDTQHRGWWIPAEDYVGAITRWAPRRVGRRQPTMSDLLNHARMVQMRVYMGMNQKCVLALNNYQKAAKVHHRRMIESVKHAERSSGNTGGPGHDSAAQKALEKATEAMREAFEEYLAAPKTGDELTSHIRYDSAEVLKSVVDRLENLNNIGIFRSHLPSFDPGATVWRYHIKALSMEERKLFVLFRLEELFLNAVQRGEQAHIQEVVVLDEAHAFCDSDESNIINTIAREARKFGLALIAASQAPNHFTEDFLMAVGTKVILRIDEMLWDVASKKLRLSADALNWITPRKTCAVQIKSVTVNKNEWRWTILPVPKSVEPGGLEMPERVL